MTNLINFNGNLVVEDDAKISIQNRALEGNIVRQKFLILQSKILFLEESYFNLMASMRKLRMKIPLNYMLEFIEKEIHITLQANKLENATITFTSFFNDNEIQFVIAAKRLKITHFIQNIGFKVDIFKEIAIFPTYINSQPLNHIENIVARKYATENDLDDVIFVTNEKKICRTTFGNIYFIFENTLIALPQKEGVYKQAFDFEFQKFIKNHSDFDLEIQSLSPFETQKMDEIFIIEEGKGVHCVSQIRQKSFGNEKTKLLFNHFHSFLNDEINKKG